MATVTIAYNHSRDPMNPDDLANKIAVALTLTTLPAVDISATQIIVTHPSVTSANTAAIQAVINAYVLDPTWKNGIVAALQAKAVTALTNNATFLALADPTAANNTYLALANPSTAQVTAQVRALTQQSNAYAAQIIALTKQVNALIRIDANQLDSTGGT